MSAPGRSMPRTEPPTDFLATLPDRPVWPRATLDEMIEVFGGPLPDEGLDAEALVTDLAAKADPGLVAIPGGRFFGFVIGGTLPAALAADWLVSAWDQNSGSSLADARPPSRSSASRASGSSNCSGCRQGASVGYVTGAQVSNFACLAVARRAMLERLGWNLNERGARNAPELRLVVGEHRHGSVDRAARFLGIGSDEIVDRRRGRRGADAARRPRGRAGGDRARSRDRRACRPAKCTPARSIRSPS